MPRASNSLSPEKALSTIPEGLRSPLIESYNSVVRNFVERRWEPSELNGGKFSEIVYTVLRGHIDGSYPTKPAKPKNMLKACLDLEAVDATRFPRSVRIQIPRVLIGLYEIRNNRNVGHAGGDVDPNHMDSLYVMHACKWVLAELVRVFHALSTNEAADVVEALTERASTLVWEVSGIRRVLDTKLSMLEKTLLILHSYSQSITERDLVACVEHSNAAVFRRDVLVVAHRRRLLEYGKDGLVTISPLGVAAAESLLCLAAKA